VRLRWCKYSRLVMYDILTGMDINAVWKTYKLNGDRKLRDQLITNYAPLVNYVALNISNSLPSNVDKDDLVSYGTFGLIDAIEKFDPERGFKFETYAIARIRGSIYDELRSIDWVPRSVRSKAKAYETAVQNLENTLLRSPTDKEIADELGITLEQLQHLTGQISHTNTVAMDDVIASTDTDSVTIGDTIADDDISPLSSYEIEEVRNALVDVIEVLTEREKIVLGLYYYEDLTLAEVGTILGVTESRVCQIHTKAMTRIREGLQTSITDLAND
jgi:RNA polymerase sigma factor FliA